MIRRLRIALILSNESQSAPFRRKSVQAEMAGAGIAITESAPDLLLVHASLLTYELLNGNLPVVILERIDSAVVLSRPVISHKNIIGVIKNTALRPTNLNNDLYCYGRYHASRIAEVLGASSPAFPDPIHTRIHLSDMDIEKIETGFTYASYDYLQEMLSASSRPGLESRTIDISFAGTTEYGAAEIINAHRRLAIHRLRMLHDFKIDVRENRIYNHNDYTAILKNSRICLSPWGLGEACYRDFEAIICGCVLVKPDTSFVKCWPDIYNNHVTYVPCKSDFSDLREICSKIISEWDMYTDMRQQAYDCVVQQSSDKAIALRLAKIFHRCYQRFTSQAGA